MPASLRMRFLLGLPAWLVWTLRERAREYFAPHEASPAARLAAVPPKAAAWGLHGRTNPWTLN